jgi:CRISPR/Cas system-associated exonuclease Cas4 (RecB family)
VSIYLSASSLKDFIACNRKLYYRFNKGDIEVQETKDMIVGNIVHYAIEKFWDLYPGASFYMIGECKKLLPNDTESVDYALACYRIYVENFKKFLSYDDDIEYKFKVPFEKDVFIVGKMDRISQGRVFDWKTDRRPLTNVSNEVQFILYNWAFKKQFGANPSGVYYASLMNGSLIRYSSDPVNEDALFTEVIPQALQAIKNKEYPRNGIFRRSCCKCPYVGVCLKE